jgi:hypothetical protein
VKGTLLIPEMRKIEANELCLFHKLERSKRSELCLFHKLERSKLSEVCLIKNLKDLSEANSTYSRNRQD